MCLLYQALLDDGICELRQAQETLSVLGMFCKALFPIPLGGLRNELHKLQTSSRINEEGGMSKEAFEVLDEPYEGLHLQKVLHYATPLLMIILSSAINCEDNPSNTVNSSSHE